MGQHQVDGRSRVGGSCDDNSSVGSSRVDGSWGNSRSGVGGSCENNAGFWVEGW